jgi:hypothetical protein
MPLSSTTARPPAQESTLPEIYPQILALPIFLAPFYKAIVVQNPAFAAAIDEAQGAIP